MKAFIIRNKCDLIFFRSLPPLLEKFKIKISSCSSFLFSSRCIGSSRAINTFISFIYQIVIYLSMLMYLFISENHAPVKKRGGCIRNVKGNELGWDYVGLCLFKSHNDTSNSINHNAHTQFFPPSHFFPVNRQEKKVRERETNIYGYLWRFLFRVE